MTNEERAKFFLAVDALEKQLGEEFGSMKDVLGNSRELSIAITKIEECAMWLRRAVERSR